jgi:hypothetical protein
MLTGSQGIDREVWARAIVLEQTRPAQGDTVGFPADGLDSIIAIRVSVRPFQYFCDGGSRPFPPFGNLLLDQHNEPG